jgi:exopolysaccharide biosynthesis polyprenyl glycosylphosphotransferase
MGTIVNSDPARAASKTRRGRRGEPAPDTHHGWPASVVLVGCDLLAAVLSAAVVKLVSGGLPGDTHDVIPAPYLLAAVVMLPLLGAAYGLYGRHGLGDHSGMDDLPRLGHTAMATAWTLVIANWVVGGAVAPVPLFAAVVGVFALTAVLRVPLRLVSRGRLIRPQIALIAGTGEVASTVAGKLARHPEYGIRVAGFVDVAPPVEAGLDVVSSDVLGHAGDLAEIARRTGATRLIVAFSLAHHDEMLGLIQSARREGMVVDIVPRLFESIGPRTGVYAIEGFQLMALPRASRSRLSMPAKRALDVVVAAAALILFSPVIAAIAIWIKLDSRGPVFYRHDRLTLGGRTFRLVKFRTMYLDYCRGPEYGGEAAEEAHARLLDRDDLRQAFELTHKLPSDPRITRAGRMLRARSLDELPQLFNVLSGDLSLVGPRPITAEELPRYGRHSHRLLAMRPGVTGYWQTNGRSQVTFDERVRLDMAYIESHTLALDFRIIAQTLPTLVGDRGAY